MGLIHPRAFCPNCGTKIHTHSDYSVIGTKEQPWGRLSAERTGTQCPSCGVALTGRVVGNRGELAMAEPRNADKLPPDQAWCTTCGVWIYAGDTVCDEGHPLEPGWEEALFEQLNVHPRSRPKKEAVQPLEGQSESSAEQADRASIVDELQRLASLHESGALTDSEFASAKARLIDDS